MKTDVCPVSHARILDNLFRRLFHNPRKILGSYIRPGMAVLDFGCGPGYFTLDMALMTGEAGHVTAADLQQGMLDIVKKKAESAGLNKIIKFHKCGQDNTGLKGKFDFILIFYMLHEVPEQGKFLKEIRQLIKLSGRVLIAEPNFHVTANDFSGSIEIMKKAGFEIIENPGIIFSRTALLKPVK